MAPIAHDLCSIDPTILEIERFNKTYRDHSSHHRNHIGVKKKDRILIWKWNVEKLKEFGYR